MSEQARRVALVTHALDGGVWAVTRFLWHILQNSGRYSPELIVLATSSRDVASVRLLSPRTWLHGPQVMVEQIVQQSFIHVGACLTEFEFQRYRPRRALTEILQSYDLVQVVAGTPAWAAVTYRITAPVCLFAATTIAFERATRLRQIQGWRKAWLKWMTHLNVREERRVLRYVDYVLAESEYTRQQLIPYVPSERLRLGPPGVDVDFFSPGSSYCASGYLIAVGRLNDVRKNARLLLTAYHQLRQTMPNAPRLVLVGHNTLSQADQTYAASLGLNDFIDIYTAVSIEQLGQLYQNATLFVLTSDEEGLGIVILEAMASGLPVISTRCGGSETAVIDGVTGLLTPVGDVGTLARAMQELLAHPEAREAMGAAGRRRVMEHFSSEAAGRVYLNTYDELLAKENS